MADAKQSGVPVRGVIIFEGPSVGPELHDCLVFALLHPDLRIVVVGVKVKVPGDYPHDLYLYPINHDTGYYMLIVSCVCPQVILYLHKLRVLQLEVNLQLWYLLPNIFEVG